MVNTLSVEILNNQTLNEICPFFILLDKDGNVAEIGTSLMKLCSGFVPNVSFASMFKTVMPQTLSTDELFKVKRLLVVRLNSANFDLKVNPISFGESLLFVGHPVINDSFSFERYGLTISDLAKHDASVEYLFLHQAMRRSMVEADGYNEQLNITNQQLSKALNDLSVDHEKQKLQAEITHSIFLSKSPEEICDFIVAKCRSFLNVTDVSALVYGWGQTSTNNGDAAEQHFNFLPVVEVSSEETDSFTFKNCVKQSTDSLNCTSCREVAHKTNLFPITTGNNTVEGCIYIGKDLRQNGAPWEVEFVEGLAKIAAIRIAELRTDYKLKHLNEELAYQVEEKTRQLKENIKNLEMFAYSVSHDLKAPLRHIFSFSSLLKDRVESQIDDTSKRYLQTVMDASHKMSNLIDALLHFSRVGTISLNKIQLDPSQLITEILDDKRIQYPNVLIETDIDVPHKIWADRILIYQVFENLISNAIKYSSRQTKVELSIVSKSDNSDIVFSISDNGIGFNSAFAKKLFLPFQRLHGSEEFEGTGIGLANVRRIIERHGGKISATSEPGSGATFTFSLPNIKMDI